MIIILSNLMTFYNNLQAELTAEYVKVVKIDKNNNACKLLLAPHEAIEFYPELPIGCYTAGWCERVHGIKWESLDWYNASDIVPSKN